MVPTLITIWLQGKRPKTVTAVLQTIQTQYLSHVDDEATILIQYDGHKVIQASWNWPFGRKTWKFTEQKDAVSDNRAKLRTRFIGMASEQTNTLAERSNPHDDPFALLVAVIQNRVKTQAHWFIIPWK